MLAGERLPEEDTDGPDVACRRGVAPGETLGRDIGERAGHVADGGQRVRLVELRQTEVEQPDRDRRAALDQHVRRLDVPVDDPQPVGVGEGIENLGCRRDGVCVVDPSCPEGLAQCRALDELVGDVDVAGITAEVVGAHAPLVPQSRRRLHLAGRSRCSLPLAGNDLQRDFEAGALIAGEPDRAGAAAAERPKRPIAIEDEIRGRKGIRRAGHAGRHFAMAVDLPASPKHGVDSARPLPGVPSVSSHDDDILDFDFFEEGATRESQGGEGAGAPSRGGGGGGGGGPRRPRLQAPHGLTPILRLVGLVAFAILIVVLLVVWAQGCSSDKKRDDYASAMADLGAIGANSAKIGDNLAEVLTTPGLKQAELETQLSGLIEQQQQGVEQAQALDVPGPLRPSTDHAIDALALRVGGMQGMLDTFVATKDDDSANATAAGEKLSAQAQRLEASDVVWQYLFRAPAQVTLENEGLGDIKAPASVFVENAELYSIRSMTAIWQRIHGASTGGTPSGVHGTGLEKTVVQPAGTQLSPDSETTVKASTDLAFDVSVKNTGENQEVSIEVTLTIPKGTTPIVKKQTIDLLDIGETATVTFKDFPEVPFGEKTSVQVSVKPVQGEQNTANNSAEYPVIFSLE